MCQSEEMIQKIMAAVAGPNATSRENYFLRESLRHLVRIAQIEREAEVKRCITLSIGGQDNVNAKRTSKLLTRKLLASLNPRQGRLDFQPRIPG